jgi:hypothetical protein
VWNNCLYSELYARVYHMKFGFQLFYVAFLNNDIGVIILYTRFQVSLVSIFGGCSTRMLFNRVTVENILLFRNHALVVKAWDLGVCSSQGPRFKLQILLVPFPVLGQSIKSKSYDFKWVPVSGWWDWCPLDKSVLGPDTESKKKNHALQSKPS